MIEANHRLSNDRLSRWAVYLVWLNNSPESRRVAIVIAQEPPEALARLCRKVAFSRENSKTVSWKINGLRAQTFLFSVICDRTSERVSQTESSAPCLAHCADERSPVP